MRSSVVIGVLLASAWARADVVDTQFKTAATTVAWSPSGVAGEVRDGELLVDVQTFERAFALDARGWTVELTFASATGKSQAPAGCEIVDGRQHVWMMREQAAIRLDQERVAVADDGKFHVYRIEAAAGRHRLLVDGKLLIDHDAVLGAVGLRDTPVVRFGVYGRAGGSDPVRFTRIVVDTAPTGLAASAHALPPAVVAGPWLQRLEALEPKHSIAFRRFAFREEARACVAFAIVAASATPRPAHYRKKDITSWLAKTDPKPRLQPAPVDPFAADPLAPSKGKSTPRPRCDPAGPCDCGRPCNRGDSTPYPLQAMRLVAQSFDNPTALETAAQLILDSAGESPVVATHPGRGGVSVAHPPPLTIDWRWLATTFADLENHPHACE